MTHPRMWQQAPKSKAMPVHGHCTNRGCLCAVEPGERYCSEYCERAAESVEATDTTEGCGCGHPECA